MRSLLMEGVPVAISPDDPGFMSYDGVTLDYCYAFLSWGLTLADLKQLAINSLKYSSLRQDEKEAIFKFFCYKWVRFLDFVIGKF